MATPDANAPTLERSRRSEYISAPAIGTDAEQAKAGLRMYRALTTLERLLRDGAISERQYDAGERLRIDHELGVQGARDTAGSGGFSGWYYAEARLAAVHRWKAALHALGPLWRYVLPICVGVEGGGEISIAALARSLGQNRQELAGIVKLGLDTLADHYELR